MRGQVGLGCHGPAVTYGQGHRGELAALKRMEKALAGLGKDGVFEEVGHGYHLSALGLLELHRDLVEGFHESLCIQALSIAEY